VLASAEVAEALRTGSGVVAGRHGLRRLRDIGRVEVFRLKRG
jgi:hypothetical protein